MFSKLLCEDLGYRSPPEQRQAGFTATFSLGMTPLASLPTKRADVSDLLAARSGRESVYT